MVGERANHAAISLQSVNVNYDGVSYTFSAVRALQVLLFTFLGGFESYSAHHFWNSLRSVSSVG
jgi:hypothetical protein